MARCWIPERAKSWMERGKDRSEKSQSRGGYSRANAGSKGLPRSFLASRETGQSFLLQRLDTHHTFSISLRHDPLTRPLTQPGHRSFLCLTSTNLAPSHSTTQSLNLSHLGKSFLFRPATANTAESTAPPRNQTLTLLT